MRALPFRVVLITDRAACAARGRGVLETVARALDGLDATAVAVLHRDKARSPEQNLRTVAALRTLCRRSGAQVLVHTHVFVATSIGLLGAHLASDALTTEGEVALARSLLAPGALLGVSAHAGDAVPREVDYALLAPVFAPTSKPDDARVPLGLGGLRAACSAGATPIIALGGVDEGNARACLDAGAQAVAVLGGIMGARDPRATLRRLLAAVC
ncbi:MAG: hypothetical protein A2138_15970 [Deltaproteobacteria bacterium RBG_16_71_12]|nr:MAG: hypothetical protein A2138_15970 [Deltaproteobacteria bacterium RBG_16_71_12]